MRRIFQVEKYLRTGHLTARRRQTFDRATRFEVRIYLDERCRPVALVGVLLIAKVPNVIGPDTSKATEQNGCSDPGTTSPTRWGASIDTRSVNSNRLDCKMQRTPSPTMPIGHPSNFPYFEMLS